MSKRNRNVEVEASEPAPVEGAVNEDGSPAGSAFGGGGDTAVEDGEMDAVGNDLPPTPEPEPRTPEPEPPKPASRREVITARIAHIERDGGPIGRTQRVNEQWKSMKALREKMVAEADKEIAELRGQVTAMEKLQQAELEEARLLKIELAKLAE